MHTKMNKKLKYWLARDKDGTLYFYNQLPIKMATVWVGDSVYIGQNDFVDEVKWEDKHPVPVELKIPDWYRLDRQTDRHMQTPLCDESKALCDCYKQLKVLHDMQKWRRGKWKLTGMPFSSKDYGKAIDTAIKVMRIALRNIH